MQLRLCSRAYALPSWWPSGWPLRSAPPSRLQIVVVGDGKQVGEALKKFGTVQVYDTDGKKVGQ